LSFFLTVYKLLLVLFFIYILRFFFLPTVLFFNDEYEYWRDLSVGRFSFFTAVHLIWKYLSGTVFFCQDIVSDTLPYFPNIFFIKFLHFSLISFLLGWFPTNFTNSFYYSTSVFKSSNSVMSDFLLKKLIHPTVSLFKFISYRYFMYDCYFILIFPFRMFFVFILCLLIVIEV